MARLLAFVAAILITALPPPPAGAEPETRIAQSGSTGGTLGKSGKSVSGGGGRSESRAPTAPATSYPFDGTWTGWLRTYGGRFNKPVEATFTAIVSHGELKGTVQMYGETRTLSAKVSPDGALVGGRLRGANSYALHGSIHRGLGEGSYFGWKLEYKMTRAR